MQSNQDVECVRGSLRQPARERKIRGWSRVKGQGKTGGKVASLRREAEKHLASLGGLGSFHSAPLSLGGTSVTNRGSFQSVGGLVAVGWLVNWFVGGPAGQWVIWLGGELTRG